MSHQDIHHTPPMPARARRFRSSIVPVDVEFLAIAEVDLLIARAIAEEAASHKTETSDAHP